jgi:ABC-type transport system involved in multi-copper enzyme maturation permease subunit
VFALFRPVDVAFILLYVISLLAIVLSFDAICGEKERGTLRLTLSNPVPRTHFVLAKFLSSWLALLFPVLLAFLVSAFLVTVSEIPFASSDWLRLGVLFGLSTLFITVFLAFGVLVSSSVHRPADSFMILLVLWVSAVLIVPKVATVASGEIADVPTVAEINSETQAFRRKIDNQVRLRHVALVDSMYEAANAYSGSKPGEFYDRNREAVEAAWRRFEKFREGKEVEFVAFSRRLGERVEARKSQMARLALSLSRISPASSYQIATTRLAGTDLGMKQRFEEAVSEFATINRKLADEKMAPSRNGSGKMEPFDLTQLPQFAQPKQTLGEVAADVILDVGLLALWALLGFAAAYVAFLRYDVR